MQRYADVVLNTQLQPVGSATVLVRPTGTTNTATIYSTNTGTATAANPITADSAGRFSFYGTNGRYDLVVSGSYIQTTTLADVMLEDVPLTNLAELSTASAARSNLGLGTSTGAFLVPDKNLSDLTTAATARANLGLAIGTNVPALSATVLTTGSQSMAGGKSMAVVTLASTGQITPDLSAGNNFQLSMTVNTTLATPSNPTVGQEFRIAIFQNSTAKTLAYNSTFYKFAAAGTATLSTNTSVGNTDVLRGYVMTTTSAECEMRNDVR